MNKAKSMAFTLSEILLVLSVIGVVSALTIPTLIQKVSDDQYKTAWKKAYTDVSAVSMRIAVDNGGSLAGVFGTNSSDENIFQNTFSQYFVTLNKCVDGTPTGTNGCWHSGGQWYKLS